MSKNTVLHSKTKHISIKYHMLREKVVEKRNQIGVCKHKRMDTKSLPKDTFEYLQSMLGVMPLPTLE